MERRVLNRAKTSDRIDDNLETIRKRFSQHDEGVVPCIEKFREQGRLVEVGLRRAVRLDHADLVVFLRRGLKRGLCSYQELPCC